MINPVLAHKLQLAVGVAAIKPQLARRQRDTEMIRVRIHKLAHDAYFLVARVRTVILVVIQTVKLIAGGAVVNVDRPRHDLFGMDKFDLLGLAVAQRRRARDAIKVKFVEGFFGDRGSGFTSHGRG